MTREESRFHDHRLVRQSALAEHLKEAVLRAVDHRRASLALFLQSQAQVLLDQRPELLHVDRRTVVRQAVLAHVEVPHADLAEVARVVSVEVALQVRQTAGITTTTCVCVSSGDGAGGERERLETHAV